MATVTFIKYKRQTGGTLRSVAQYVSQAKKTVAQTGHPLASGLNCTPRLAAQEFIATRTTHRKNSPVWFYHYVQSFSPEEKITGEQAHRLAKEFAARAWPCNEVLSHPFHRQFGMLWNGQDAPSGARYPARSAADVR